MNNLIDNRHIRVFISSTFSDMKAERTYLMNRTFPRLRVLAAERDVTLTAVDLRWGITKKESQSGKVVEICLREIENSIPFFIGIIGNRYGWVPTKNDLGGNVSERYPVVDKYVEQNLSMKEMEMQFGVLSRGKGLHASFFIKEPEKIADNPKRVHLLKKKVRDSGYPSSTYQTPEQLGQRVEGEFVKLLDKLFPVGVLSELEKERIGQRSFLHQLCQNYIHDSRAFVALDAWLANSKNHRFVVTGPSGMGKSALIANWVQEKLADANREYNIIYHFAGHGGSESSKEHITKCLTNEILDLYGWGSTALKPQSTLDDLFEKISSDGDKPLLIVVDAINQIVDADNAKSLNWLPVSGRNIKILFSTLEDDRTMDVFKMRNFPSYTLRPLDENLRRRLICNHLGLHGRSLAEEQIARISQSPQCKNTLVLKTLLQELISFGAYEQLDERIDYYLTHDTEDDFYQAMLSLYEDEYKDYGKTFVERILSIIAVSKDGLTEDEIIAIANIKKPIRWSQFYCAFDSMFCQRNGKIIFGHIAIREAVEKRYKLNKRNCKYRRKIIAYFQRYLQQKDWRACVECVFQLYKLGTKESADCLYGFLKDPSLSGALFGQEEVLCRQSWLLLRRFGYESFNCFIESKESLIGWSDYAITQQILFDLSRLLDDFGSPWVSIELKREFVNYLETIPETDSVVLAKAFSDLANECAQAVCNISNQDEEIVDEDEFQAYADEAIRYYNKSVEIAKEHSQTELAVAYKGLADLRHNRRQNELAWEHASNALDIYIANYGIEHHEVAACYNTLSNISSNLGKFDEAIEYSIKGIEIIKCLYGIKSDKLIVPYWNLAVIRSEAGLYNDALESLALAFEIINIHYGDDYYDMESFLSLKKDIEGHLPMPVRGE